MKKNFSRDLAIEVIAVSDKVMSIEDAERFAKENGGRLPDQVEAMLILSESHYPDISNDNCNSYWCTFTKYYDTSLESCYGSFSGCGVNNMLISCVKEERFWCGVIVVKDAE